MSNEPISKRPRVSSIQDTDLLLISQKQLDDSYESKSVEVNALKGKNGEKGEPGINGDKGLQGEKGDKGDKGEPGPINSTYNTQGMFSPDYQNNQNSMTSAAGTFLRRDLTSDSFSCYLYYKNRFFLPNNAQFTSSRTPTISVKLLSMFVYLDSQGKVIASKEANLYSSSPTFHSSSGRWYVDIKIIIPDVVFKPSDVNAAQIGFISDAMSIIDNSSAKRLNCSSDLSGFFGILPKATTDEVVAVPQIILSAL